MPDGIGSLGSHVNRSGGEGVGRVGEKERVEKSLGEWDSRDGAGTDMRAGRELS